MKHAFLASLALTLITIVRPAPRVLLAQTTEVFVQSVEVPILDIVLSHV